MNDYSNALIYGKCRTERIVNIETDGPDVILWRELESGEVVEERMDATYWILTNQKVSSKQRELAGTQFYKYMAHFDDPNELQRVQNLMYQKRLDFYRIYDHKESQMVYNGITYYKGMKPQDVSILSFDIETTGIKHDKNSKIYIISNTFRRAGKVIKRLFALDDYDSESDMLLDWCEFVRSSNPSIICGHNIFNYDFWFIGQRSNSLGITLNLGRDGSPLRFNTKHSRFRKDGSQEYEYFKCFINGREIVDTFFLSMKYDIGRSFPSYGLKPIIKYLNMEKEGRTFVDAGKIRQYYENRVNDPEMWQKVKDYANDDSDDALKLYDLMCPSFFYMTQSISKSYQEINCGATGSQINNMMVRSYLQDGHSIAQADEVVPYEGALSLGIPGHYKHCVRWDIASLYPSIMRQYKIHSPEKDPKNHFLQMVEFFTLERLKNKQLAKETGQQYYKDLEGSQKVMINSKYGFLSAPGLNYNYPAGAAEITKKGRQILGNAVYWASGLSVEELYAKNESEETISE